ncbi:hypothetical protein SAMN05216326_11278 [Nitrosomonas marina]|uniref:Uncharacterized protein n=1 Tax=Nitrosomonas marina TaxID=917 RepID=A0A1I0BZZ9_9PROT|nr:hypothetical protein [Nitrosomonas marina]SET12291.1 hypothetical protein SAMN05216326_11278 [Nitrosomonas marina]
MTLLASFISAKYQCRIKLSAAGKRENKSVIIEMSTGFFNDVKLKIPLYKQGNIAIKIMIFPCSGHGSMLEFPFDLVTQKSCP